MNLIKIYGKLKQHYGTKESYKFCFDLSKRHKDEYLTDYELYIKKLERLIEIVEYKLGIRTQDEMNKDYFNEEDEKNDWVLHTFTHNYQKDVNCYHYYRKCSICGDKFYSLHSRYERKNIKCYECKQCQLNF